LPCLLTVTLAVRELREGRQGSPLRPGRAAFHDRGGSRVLYARHPPRSSKPACPQDQTGGL